MTEPHPTDALMAAHYERVRDRLHVESECAAALSMSVVHSETAFGTFAPAVAAAFSEGYNLIAEKLAALADDAQGLVLDYRAHADGTYVSLSPSVLL